MNSSRMDNFDAIDNLEGLGVLTGMLENVDCTEYMPRIIELLYGEFKKSLKDENNPEDIKMLIL